jgi:hypothetical protein
MIIHRIKNLDNNHVIDLLKDGLTIENSTDLKYNYSPLYQSINSNIFYLLKNGRYNIGSYFVIENENKYVCSAGWNNYDDNTALILTRAYINKEYRAQYIMASHLLPIMIKETESYKNVWITCNKNNVSLYKWFERSVEGKTPALFNNWPNIYKDFKPIGIKLVNYVEQYVLELQK